MFKSLDKRIAYIKSPDSCSYCRMFTALPAVLYIIFCILSYFKYTFERTDSFISIMAFAFIVLLFMFDNISMLLFGKIYRKNMKGMKSEWPMQCYALLMMLDICFIFYIYSSGSFSEFFLKYNGLMTVMFMLNIFVPTLIVPLPVALKSGKRITFLVGSVFLLLSCSYLWIIFCTIIWNGLCIMGDEKLYDLLVSFYNCFPFSTILLKEGCAGYIPVIIYVFALLFFIAGYCMHVYFVSYMCEERFKNAFSALTCIIISCAVGLSVIFSCTSNMMEMETYTGKKLVSMKHGRKIGLEQLRQLYIGGESENIDFWNSMNEHYSEITEIMDGLFAEDKLEVYQFYKKSHAIYSDEWFDKYSVAFEKCLPVIEKIDAEINGLEIIPKSSYAKDLNLAFVGDIIVLSAYANINNYRIVKCVKNDDIANAMVYLRMAYLIEKYFVSDVRIAAGRECCKFTGLLYFLNSGKANETQLRELYAMLTDIYSRHSGFYENISFCDDVRFFKAREIEAKSAFVPVSCLSDCVMFMSPNASLWILPQYHWTFYSRYYSEIKAREKSIYTNDIEKQYKSSLLRLNIAMLDAACELHKCKFGKYPTDYSEFANDMLFVRKITDPFTGKPIELKK